MTRLHDVWLALAALSGAIAVAAGAFAAHGVADPLARELLRTGANYALAHALAVFACAAVGGGRAWRAAPLFVAGAALFSGSLYALAAGAPPWVGAVTPAGGLLLITGWTALAWAALSRARTLSNP